MVISVLHRRACRPARPRDVDRSEVVLDRHAADDPVLQAAQLLVAVDDTLLELEPAGEGAAEVPGRGLLGVGDQAEMPARSATTFQTSSAGRAMRAVERSDVMGCLSSSRTNDLPTCLP